jgi:hypothetical protein
MDGVGEMRGWRRECWGWNSLRHPSYVFAYLWCLYTYSCVFDVDTRSVQFTGSAQHT